MAKIFIGIALVVALATAALGFLTKGKVDQLQLNKKEALAGKSRAEGTLKVRDGELKKSQEEVTSTKASLEEKDKEVTAKNTEIGTLTKEKGDLKTQADDKDKSITELEEKLKIAMAGKPGGGPEPNPEVIAALQERVKDAEAKAAEAKQIQETLDRKVKANESRMAELEQYKRSRESSVQRLGVQGRILAVNSGWNFVVLSIGDKQGLLTNSPLLVMRGGEPIARVRVTSVEPSTSIADVIPGSVRKGVTVQPGDHVVVEGGRGQPPHPAQPSPASEPAPAPAPQPAR